MARDPRRRTGELRSAVFDGSTCPVREEPLSEMDSADNWYPNVAAEVNSAGELGILYMRGRAKDHSESVSPCCAFDRRGNDADAIPSDAESR